MITQVADKNNQPAVAAASVDDAAHAGLPDDLPGRAASCFARRETRQTCRDMVNGLLTEPDDRNRETMAGAAGHSGPHRMQHFLSRARVDDQGILDTAADWAAEHLAGGQDSSDVIPIVGDAGDAGDAKSSADCAGAARQYSGTPGQVALCQVPELLRLLRGTVIPPPRRDREHVLDWSHWRRQHQHRARQAHQRWNAYADASHDNEVQLP